MRPRRPILLAILPLILSAPALGDLRPDPDGDVAASDGLSGREVYDRVVAHRLRSFALEAVLESGNGEGDRREMRFRLAWKDYRGSGDGLLSKTRIDLDWPFDLRFGGILIERKRGQPAQQWAYASVFRRVFRISLRGVTIQGSDFAFDDVVPPEAQDFRYRRIADEVYDGLPVYVVELYPTAEGDSDHSRILVSIDKARDVVLRARYYDALGVQTKELSIPPSSLRRYGESWFPHLLTMRRLGTGSYTTLRVETFNANPDLDRREFDLGRLESR